VGTDSNAGSSGVDVRVTVVMNDSWRRWITMRNWLCFNTSCRRFSVSCSSQTRLHFHIHSVFINVVVRYCQRLVSLPADRKTWFDSLNYISLCSCINLLVSPVKIFMRLSMYLW